MRFAQPEYINFLWLVLLLILFLFWAFKRKKQIMRRFAEEGMLKEIASSMDPGKQKMKAALIILAVVLGLLALMRPQWGFQWQEVKRRGLDIIIAVDLSKSMLAADVLPNRLERSKLAVKDLLKKVKGDRIGLIGFAGTAFLSCPLTVDYDGFLLALNDLDVRAMPRGGTSISSAIKQALKSYEGGQKKYKNLIIITDGEDHEGDALAAAEIAGKEAVKIFCIGIGTIGGELVQVRDEQGNKTFLKDQDGNVVKSRLNEALLQKIALLTGGTYVRSSGAEFGLDWIYEEKLASLEKREIQAKMSKLYIERFQIPLALALFFLIMETWISDKRKI
ncbi:MAG: VWA domain-containing protein [Candidatus Omnitrophota bacterium]